MNSFRGNYSFFEFNLMYCDLWSQYIQVRKLFKGGNYSRAETIRGNTVSIFDRSGFFSVSIVVFYLFQQGSSLFFSVSSVVFYM